MSGTPPWSGPPSVVETPGPSSIFSWRPSDSRSNSPSPARTAKASSTRRSDGRAVAKLLRRGDISGSPFGFRTIGDDWSETDDGYPLRTLTEVALRALIPYRSHRGVSGRLGPVRHTVAVATLLLSGLVSCGTDPLDNCVEEADGTLDCSQLNLSHVDLSDRNLTDINFSYADLSESDLRGAVLIGADMKGASLGGVVLTGAVLVGADLSHAYLWEVDLLGSNLERVDLSESMLDRSNFSRANLRKANLYAAHGPKVRFAEANLSGANFYGTDFSTWDFTGAKADDETVWPDDFDPVAAGVIFE